MAAGGAWGWRGHQHGEACDLVRASVEGRGDAPVGTGPREIIVIGDSYAQGWGLRNPMLSWPTAFAHEADATVRVDGFAGSGFTGSAFCDDEDFGARAGRLDLDPDDLLVVQGGLNDVNAAPEAIESAAVAVVEASGADGGRGTAAGAPAGPRAHVPRTRRSPGPRTRPGSRTSRRSTGTT